MPLQPFCVCLPTNLQHGNTMGFPSPAGTAGSRLLAAPPRGGSFEAACEAACAASAAAAAIFTSMRCVDIRADLGRPRWSKKSEQETAKERLVLNGPDFITAVACAGRLTMIGRYAKAPGKTTLSGKKQDRRVADGPFSNTGHEQSGQERSAGTTYGSWTASSSLVKLSWRAAPSHQISNPSASSASGEESVHAAPS